MGRYFFTTTCHSDNYLFQNSNTITPPLPRLIIEWCFYNSHIAHARRCIHMMLFITEKNVSMIIRFRLYYHVCDSKTFLYQALATQVYMPVCNYTHSGFWGLAKIFTSDGEHVTNSLIH